MMLHAGVKSAQVAAGKTTSDSARQGIVREKLSNGGRISGRAQLRSELAKGEQFETKTRAGMW